MLQVRLACGQGDFYVGKRRTHKNSLVNTLLNMRDYQPLPIQTQAVDRALGCADYTAPLGQRVNAQMHLGIMP